MCFLEELKIKEIILINTYNLIFKTNLNDLDLKRLTFEIDEFRKYNCDEYLDIKSYNEHLDVCINKLFKTYLKKINKI